MRSAVNGRQRAEKDHLDDDNGRRTGVAHSTGVDHIASMKLKTMKLAAATERERQIVAQCVMYHALVRAQAGHVVTLS